MVKQNIASIWYRGFLLFSVLVLLQACGGSSGNQEDTGVTPLAANGTVTLLELNDLHAHLTAHNDMEKVDNSSKVVHRGGLARIATLVKQIRATNPNTLLMNIGDTYHGGVEALYTQGNAIVEPLNALAVDVGVPGNWDFAYGPGVTRLRYTDIQDQFTLFASDIKKPNFQNLAANVTLTSPPGQAGEYFLPPTMIKSFGSIKVGFIGITSDIVPRMHSMLAAGLSFLETEEDYLNLIEKHANELREQGVNLVVVMSELGIHKDYQLANQFSSGLVDLVFSAHTHELTKEPLVASSGTWVVESGNDTVLGQMDVVFEDGNIINKTWQLLNIDNTIEEDIEVKALVDAARAPFLSPDPNMTLSMSDTEISLSRPINTVIGHLHEGTDRRHALANDFNLSYTAMLKQHTGTQVAITPGFRYDAVIAESGVNYEDPVVISGDMTIEDAYRFFPVPFTLSTANVTGSRLKEIIESNLSAVFSTNAFNQSGGWFDGFAGIDLSINLAHSDNQRVVELRSSDNGVVITDIENLSITGCSRPFDFGGTSTLCSYDGFTNVTPLINTTTGKTWSGIEFLIYGVENNLFSKSTANIVDQNNTPLWPAQPFYQPLQGVAVQ